MTVVAALFAGLVVAVLAVPSSGVDTYPPVCWAWRGYEVPCNATPAYLAAHYSALDLGYLTMYLLSNKLFARMLPLHGLKVRN